MLRRGLMSPAATTTVPQRPPKQQFLSPQDSILLRRVRGWSMREVSIRTGISCASLCLFETARRELPPDAALRLLRCLMFAPAEAAR